MTAVERVRAAFARIAEVDRPEVWITLRAEADVVADAAAVDRRVAAGEALPLAGRTLAVKDNIDVAGLPTTAACPAFAYEPAVSAPAVARLVAAGALVLGKTNLDQFATGLVGTRSPHGAVRDAHRPAYVSGGSSSGSAVAVALGIADVALGTDTAGSGRIPAAFGGIVGVKPTRGLVPLTGVVPACRTLDVVTTLARDLADATLAADLMAGDDAGADVPPDTSLAPADTAVAPAGTSPAPVDTAVTPPGTSPAAASPAAADPRWRPWPPDAPLAAPPDPVVGVPPAGELEHLTPAARAAFDAAVERLRAGGAGVTTVDVTPIVAAGTLLYGGAFVAERHAAVGAFVASHPADVDPTVAGIVTAAAEPSASALVADGERLDEHRLATRRLFAGLDALLLPTTVAQPTIAAVAADPVGANAALGRWVNGCNLLDLCAVAVPAGAADGGRFGVMLYAPAFHDAVVRDLAARVVGEDPPPPVAADAPGRDRGAAPTGIPLLVVGAHLQGQPLNHQLTDRGARLEGPVRTAPEYRLFALDTVPPKPGLVRSPAGGVSIAGELWHLPPAGLAGFLQALPQPMALGRARLDDGREVVGFVCEPTALTGARDITASGGWRQYLADVG